jgi:hypothetical protein
MPAQTLRPMAQVIRLSPRPPEQVQEGQRQEQQPDQGVDYIRMGRMLFKRRRAVSNKRVAGPALREIVTCRGRRLPFAGLKSGESS